MLTRWSGLALVASMLVGAAAVAADRPVSGDRLRLRASAAGAERGEAQIVLRDAAIAEPFADPTAGAWLLVSGGAGEGQCRAEIELPASGWRPIDGDGERSGFFYLDRRRTSGVRWILVQPGLISIRAGRRGWPCGDSDAAQRLPVSVQLRLGTDRYCAAWGGEVLVNQPLRFAARDAPAPPACPKRDLSVATLNILHGIFCPQGTAGCRRQERTDLLFEWIAASGCPDVVTLQEVSEAALPLLAARLDSACPFAYQMAAAGSNPIDDHVVLTRYPLAATELRPLFLNFRTVLFARIDHPVGPFDVFTTHLASGADRGPAPCGASCPAECVAAGAVTNRDCQAVQMAELAAARHDVDAPAVLTGDFNDPPGSFVYDTFVGRGWIDSYLAGGGPECDPTSGIGCTSGREDEALDDMESPASGVDERIDYIFVLPPGPASSCAGHIDSAADDDGDGVATKIFADDANPFAPACGPAPEPICWPSDHEGVQLDLNCD